jgi:hypothetical protein
LKEAASQVDKVWVVESGEYSDYRVHLACATKEHAEAVAAHMNASRDTYEHYQVASLPLYTECEFPSRVQHFVYGKPPHTGGRPGEQRFPAWDFDLGLTGDEVEVYGDLWARGTDAARVRKAWHDAKARRDAINAGIADA